MPSVMVNGDRTNTVVEIDGVHNFLQRCLFDRVPFRLQVGAKFAVQHPARSVLRVPAVLWRLGVGVLHVVLLVVIVVSLFGFAAFLELELDSRELVVVRPLLFLFLRVLILR